MYAGMAWLQPCLSALSFSLAFPLQWKLEIPFNNQVADSAVVGSQ
jgi:hypothetical protein